MVFSFLEMQRRLIQTKVYYKPFCFVWKCVYHCYNLLRWMFFTPCDNWKTLFFIQIYRYPEVWYNPGFAAFFDTSVLKEVHVLYPLSPQSHHNAANSKGPKYNFYLLNVLNKTSLLVASFTLSVCLIPNTYIPIPIHIYNYTGFFS